MPIVVIKSAVEKFLDQANGSFDFIFADPPYAFTQEQLLALADKLTHNKWMNEEGLLVLEHDKHISLSDHLQFEEERTYGSSRFSFYCGNRRKIKAGHKPDSVEAYHLSR